MVPAVLNIEWLSLVGLSDYCQFNRQLSETRTRVEIATSFWLEGAIFVNNNFVVQDFLEDDAKYEVTTLSTHYEIITDVVNIRQ